MHPEPDRRGRYDRTESARSRAQATRRRLIAAAAEILAQAPDREFTLVEVAAATGVGRARIYALFAGSERLRRVAHRLAARSVTAALRTAAASTVTPLERLRALARAWCDVAEGRDPCARLAIRLACAPGPSPIRICLAAELGAALRAARASGLIARHPASTTIELLTAAWALGVAGASVNADPALPDRLAELVWRATR